MFPSESSLYNRAIKDPPFSSSSDPPFKEVIDIKEQQHSMADFCLKKLTKERVNKNKKFKDFFLFLFLYSRMIEAAD